MDELAEEQSEAITCGYCGTATQFLVPIDKLIPIFQRWILNDYVPTGEMELPLYFLKRAEGWPLEYLIEEDWPDIWSSATNSQPLLNDLLNGTGPCDPSEPAGLCIDDPWSRKEEDWVSHVSEDEEFELEYESGIPARASVLKHALETLEKEVTEHGIFFHGDKYFERRSKAVRDAVRDTRDALRRRKSKLPRGTCLYRARIGRFTQCSDMGAPPPHRSIATRCSPQGWPVLYCTLDKETALREVRPMLGDEVTVVKFSLAKPVMLCDMTLSGKPNPFVISDGEFQARYIDLIDTRTLRQVLAGPLAKPIRRADESSEYLFTQTLVSFIANEGLDGVQFTSSQHPVKSATNVVLFDTRHAKSCGEVATYRVTSASFQFEPCTL